MEARQETGRVPLNRLAPARAEAQGSDDERVSPGGALAHGTRARYKSGCRCTRCRAANAAYWRRWHIQTRAGRPLLGARVSAVEAHRLIKIMRAEWIEKRRLAAALGISPKNLARLSHQRTISLRMWLKIRRLYRQCMRAPAPSEVLTGEAGRNGLENR